MLPKLFRLIIGSYDFDSKSVIQVTNIKSNLYFISPRIMRQERLG
uniref:Uncharacterized protein n=1 Tax=Lepeophtheirus salmonis TaxID=72036 RepID=A0A0K2VEN1_LEPSM